MSEDQHPTDELPPTEPAPTDSEPSAAGADQRIGPYRLLRKLGEGGMGEVWLAEQTKPIKRRVALKLIKHGLDTERVVARFEAERQALAMMDHPHLAKVFEAGSTPHGRPYFVMEYVQGVPITEHCDRHRLSNQDRLQLFRQVCDGVQHAHQKAIIHRDLKPSNVLVSIQNGKAAPKIIDFGVAKAISHKLTERTLFTEMGQLVGTPEYMSPEQAEMTGQNVDTRTDVYSLGVILYELLVGVLPFDSKELREAGFQGLVRKIREDEPPKPSTRLSMLGQRSTESARKRRVDRLTLQRQLRGDLDWITMKTLEKDRMRRYGSPSELSEDIRRHIEHQPVLAGPPSAGYRARKFIRRHRVGVTAAALTMLVLLAFSITTTVQSRRVAREARTSQRVSEFLANMLGNVEPEELGGLLLLDLRERIESVQRERGLEEAEIGAKLASFEDAMLGVNATDSGLRLLDELVLGRARETVHEQLTTEPRIAAYLEHTIGDTYTELGLYDRAEPCSLRALELRGITLGLDHPETLASMNSLARIYYSQGRFQEAESQQLDTLEARKRVLGDDHPDTLQSMTYLANVYSRLGRLDEAEPLRLGVLETSRRVLGEEHPDTISSMHNLANLYSEQTRYAEAESLMSATLEASRRVLGNDHRLTLSCMANLANALVRLARYDEATSLLTETLDVSRRVLGNDHPNTLWRQHYLAVALQYRGDYDEAEQLYSETLKSRRRILGNDHPDTLWSLASMADLFHRLGRYDETEPLYLEVLESRQRVLGQEHPDSIRAMNSLATLYRARGHYDKAEPLHAEALESCRRVRGPDHHDTEFSTFALGHVYFHLGRYDEAEPLYLEALAIRKRVAGDEAVETLRAMNTLARLYTAQQRYIEAEQLYSVALEISTRVHGSDHQHTRLVTRKLADLDQMQERLDDARPDAGE